MTARRFTKLLIANRGEIACRVIRTAKRMGLATVAVFSDADRDALHVALADEAVRIGSAPARASYLRADAIVAAARATGAQAIHPGYGFLSENAAFADACAAAGLVFVGPSAETMRRMGDKTAAKALMETSGVPLLPGYHGEAQHLGVLGEAAAKIGYPVLVKAAAGGGGKGMRVVRAPEELSEALAGAKREAASAFGDDRVLIEKYLDRPRHIEVQVFGDTHGNVLSLFERECTLQRRHQKVIEEAPSPSLAPERREAISRAARDAAAAVSYVGAGTVEFVADESGFYFIEMNTRLQVEHPVTEMITGFDLVEWQLRVAAAERFTRGQDDIRMRGHAVEARIYAEDAEKGFLPSTGVLNRWRAPPARDGLRVESGFREGDAVTPHYDPMLAKLIAWAPDRARALDRLAGGLRRFEIAGVTTNIPFLSALVAHPDVRRGAMDTGLIERELAALTAPTPLTPRDLATAAGAVLLHEQAARTSQSGDPHSAWDRADGWMVAGERRRRLAFVQGAQAHELVVTYARAGLIVGGEAFRAVAREGGAFDVFLGDAKEAASAVWTGRDLALVTPRGGFRLRLADPTHAETAAAAGDDRIVAPMPGTVTRILAAPGATLARGDPVLVVEAMKMEHTLRAPANGRVQALHCSVGDAVQEGAELAEFAPADEAPG